LSQPRHCSTCTLRHPGPSAAPTAFAAVGKRAISKVSTEPASPAVQLVASYLGDVDIERRDGLGPGVTVVVGKQFGRPAEGEQYVEVDEAATVCGPAVD